MDGMVFMIYGVRMDEMKLRGVYTDYCTRLMYGWRVTKDTPLGKEGAKKVFGQKIFFSSLIAIVHGLC